MGKKNASRMVSVSENRSARPRAALQNLGDFHRRFVLPRMRGSVSLLQNMAVSGQSWRVSIEEWESLGHLLLPPEGPTSRRRSLAIDPKERLYAEVCLLRYFTSLSWRYRSFGWNALPKAIAGQITAATANRRFNQWLKSGRLSAFWSALELQRKKQEIGHPNTRGSRIRRIIGELERAYAYFNEKLFRGSLPNETLITFEAHCRLLGEFRPKPHGPWIAIMDKALALGTEGALQVLIHEMVHLWNWQAGVSDVGRAQYHNRYFRDAALLAGLVCSIGSKGYAYTSLGPPALAVVRELDCSVLSLSPLPRCVRVEP